MATYAIGDVQGCFATLEKLLSKIAFDAGRDVLWFAGDLVNRGPASLETLRFAYEHRDAVRLVLGNHDLHLLGRVAGVRRAGRRDTLDEVLAAPDLDELVAWLRKQPLVFREDGWLLVHAGVLPTWTPEEAQRRSDVVQNILRDDDENALLTSLYTKRPPPKALAEPLETLSVTTLLRVLDPDGRPALEFKRAPEDAPAGLRPWFDAADRATSNEVVLFGHWAALGYRQTENYIALDSGCVWGHRLTAVRLEDRAVFQANYAD